MSETAVIRRSLKAGVMRRLERRIGDLTCDDILKAFGLEDLTILRREAKLLLRRPARGFARSMLAFDADVAERGIAAAAASFLPRLDAKLEISGARFVPPEGPTLFVSNHPGIADTAALFAALGRSDLKIIAAARPFLIALPAISERLILVPDDPAKSHYAIRPALDHLKRGGALLNFPAGAIEPDPAFLPGAVASLGSWSPSVELFARMHGALSVVPVAVSGVFARQALRSVLTLLRRRERDRESLAAMLQLMTAMLFPGRWKARVRVDILEGFDGSELAARGGRGEVLSRVREQMAAALSRAR